MVHPMDAYVFASVTPSQLQREDVDEIFGEMTVIDGKGTTYLRTRTIKTIRANEFE